MRPRLVKEGSPIQDQQKGSSAEPPISSDVAFSDRGNRDRRSSSSSSSSTGHANRHNRSLESLNTKSSSSQPYKLTTHLVIGGNGSNGVNSFTEHRTGAEERRNVDEWKEPEELLSGSTKSSHHYSLGESKGAPSVGAPTTTYETRNVVDNNHRAGGRHQSSHHYTFGGVANHQRDTETMDHEPMEHESVIDEPKPNHHYVFGQSSQENRQIYSQQIESKSSKPPTQQARHVQSPPQLINQVSDSSAPLVVLDGANVAYDFAETMKPSLQKREPDPKGIRLAIDYFLKNNCRVVAVVPRSWYQLKPRPGDHYHLKNRGSAESDAKMLTEEVEELRLLRSQGLLVACPPGDDDDAYAIGLARRETDRALEQQLHEDHDDESMSMDDDNFTVSLPSTVFGGYVVSNDFYNDAIRRDDMSKQHQNESLALAARASTLKKWLGLHRISYSFANVGGKELEFVPNPRNVLIEAIDACRRLNCMR